MNPFLKTTYVFGTIDESDREGIRRPVERR